MMQTQARPGRFTRTEKSWILYDWANSVYATIIMAAVFPIYFAEIAGKAGISGDVWWGYATSLATLTVALLSPVLGAIGDFRGMKKKLFTAFLLTGLVFTTTMALTDRWQMMLIGYIFSYIGFSGSLLFYDSFITDVTTADRMDRLSAWGYAMGYIGGSTIPFIVSIGLILFGARIGIDGVLAVKVSCLICVGWWAVFSVPMLRQVKQTHYEDMPASALIRSSIRNMAGTARDIFANKAIFVFVLAYFFYIDGVNTVIHMATVYGSSLGLGTQGMILALLVTQIVAVPCSIAFSHLAGRWGAIRMIRTAIIIYFIICTVGFYMGFSLEPSQKVYTDGFRTAADRGAAAADLTAVNDADRTAFQKQLDDWIQSGSAMLAGADRQTELARSVEEAAAEAAAHYQGETLNQIQSAWRTVGRQVDAYLADPAASVDFDRALKRSALLFWAMAVLVGTCQGGIQALSRSFFGKLIPANRSNEYFGFFDVFGKFAAVMGPALYAFIAHITGRSSFGILSLMALFAVGLAALTIGRSHLARAQSLGQENARRSLENNQRME